MIATTTSDTAPQSTPASLPVLLAFTAGYVDTVGFVGLFGLFTAHVTGNFVLIGSEIAKPTSGVLIKFLQALLLLGFMVAGWLALPLHDASTPAALMAGMLGAAAMGIQNAAGKLIWNALTPTTVMTGNVTQLVIDVVDLVRGSSEAGTAARMRRFFWPVVAFGVGAIAGALGFVEFSFLALALPIVLIAGLAWQSALGRH
jgi:uncharacterized membrane protein YoaK (UPF0700 family)